jgi:AcrR family transcriptional regulator
MVKPISQPENATRNAILTAARWEFTENGLRGARMQEIADRAGINKALLHYHFRDKEGLYQATIQSVIEEVVKNIARPFLDKEKPRSAEESIRELVRELITILRQNPHLVGMVLRELSDGGKHLAPLLATVAPWMQQIARGVFGQKKSPKGVPPAHLMMNMMFMIWGTFVFQPMYTKILPAAGFDIILNEAFYEDRVKCISAMVIQSIGIQKGGEQ